MTKLIQDSTFANALQMLLQETFVKVVGIYLDGGTSLFETLEQVSAERASQPIVPNGSTVVAHTSHVQFYLELLAQYMTGGKSEGKVDWAATWKTKTATVPEWDALVQKLRATYQRVDKQIKSVDDWNAAKNLEGAMAIVVHTAFHLGAIRQILTVVGK